ncbi:hypothetical protein VTN00DRAFT_6772 [Thermoascus crustaceus]|uniref:uncharacterized protein n=1 Tax=Thermoascus crustaceus TaxID=5088 RepID=UPI0037445AEB
MHRSPPQPIRRLLIANRGEIAVRILHAARELPSQSPIETFALYTPNDHSHIDLGHPDHALLLPHPAAYMDIDHLVHLAKDHSIDAIHPGYGFLSESPEFARRMWDEAQARVIGPGWEVLAQMGDKLAAKTLAGRCGVPVLKALTVPSQQGGQDLDEIRTFVTQVGYPVMIKAVDGGGGRGIRLVSSPEELQTAVDRARGESASQTVFVENAAVGGFHHVEVQIVGDGRGEVRHLWERDCSVQRRFQKVVECAPAVVGDRRVIGRVVDAAVRIAREIKYLSLGTFEFLVNPQSSEFYFLEINPRLQVEHTITECISDIDLVQIQLLLAQGSSLNEVGLGTMKNAEAPPNSFSIQLRLCAEDPNTNFALSIGKVTEFVVPSGNGIRVDTHISSSSPVVVGSDFDNLLTKIIVTAPSWEGAVRKAQRVLADSRISGVKTNIDVLRGIVAHGDFIAGKVDTQWLERNLEDIVRLGEAVSKRVQGNQSALPMPVSTSSVPSSAVPSSSSLLFRKGDAWSITLEPHNDNNSKPNISSTQQNQQQHHLHLTRILRNEFPSSLSAEIEYTAPPTLPTPTPYRLHLTSTSSSASALASASSHRRGDPWNPRHIVLPMAGKLVEVLVAEGDEVRENDVLAFVRQMKMELEVRSPRAGRVKWVLDVDDGDEEGGGSGVDVAEGVLLAELEEENHLTGGRDVGLKGKL